VKAEMRCAWCDTFMYWTDTSDGKRSDGICESCLQRVFGLSKEDLLRMERQREQRQVKQKDHRA